MSYPQFENLSALELQPAVQAMIIYMIMGIIEKDNDTPSRGERMLETTQVCNELESLPQT
jgi:hypothetical protein